MSGGLGQLAARKTFDEYPDLPNAFTKLGVSQVSGRKEFERNRLAASIAKLLTAH